MKLVQTPPCILLTQNLEKNFKKKRERWGIQKGNSYCKSYLSLPFRSKASKLKCVAMLSSHCLCNHSLLNANVRHTRTIETSNLKQKYHGNAWLLKA